MKIRFIILLFGCALMLFPSPGWGEDRLHELAVRAAEYRASSSSRMDETLKTLRANTQEAVAENRKLEEKNRRFEERAKELEQEIQRVEVEGDKLLNTRDGLLDQLKEEVSRTQLMQHRIDELNGHFATVDQQELSIKDRIINQDVEQAALRRRADQLRGEISALKDKLSHKQSRRGIQYSPAFVQQKQALADQLLELERAKAAIQQHRAERQRFIDEARRLRAQADEFRRQQRDLSEELTALKYEERTLRNSYTQLQQQEGQQLSRVDQDIKALMARREELTEASKQTRLLQKALALSIPEAKLRENVAQLTLEHDVLQEQAVLLGRQENIIAAASVNMADQEDSISRLEAKVASLRQEENTLLLTVEQRGREVKQAGDTLAGLRDFLPRLKKALQVVKERNDRKLRAEQDRFVKDATAAEKFRMSLQDKNTLMKDRLNALRQEVDELVLESTQLSQQQQAKDAHGAYDMEKLKAEAKNLALNKEYLLSTLKTVRAKLKESDSAILPWSTNEEKDLADHITSLKQENKHLQVELLSIGMEDGTMDGSRRIQVDGPKNL